MRTVSNCQTWMVRFRCRSSWFSPQKSSHWSRPLKCSQLGSERCLRSYTVRSVVSCRGIWYSNGSSLRGLPGRASRAYRSLLVPRFHPAQILGGKTSLEEHLYCLPCKLCGWDLCYSSRWTSNNYDLSTLFLELHRSFWQSLWYEAQGLHIQGQTLCRISRLSPYSMTSSESTNSVGRSRSLSRASLSWRSFRARWTDSSPLVAPQGNRTPVCWRTMDCVSVGLSSFCGHSPSSASCC